MISRDGSAGIGRRSHVVQLYRREEELAGRVAAYLAPAIVDRGAALLVAAPAHRAAITARLGDAGVDAAAADLPGALRISIGDASLLPDSLLPGSLPPALPARPGHGLGAVAAMTPSGGCRR